MDKPHRDGVGRPDVGCSPGPVARSLSIRQWLLAVCGLGLLAAGIAVEPGWLPVGPALITVGGIVVLVGVALPYISQVNLSAPLLVGVSLAASERRKRLHESVEDSRGLLVACATNLCLDEGSASRAVNASVSRALGDWHGTDAKDLRQFLLCLLVQEARFEATVQSAEPIGNEPFLLLPRDEREVLVLVDRAGLGRSAVAQILGVTPSQVAELYNHALSTLTGPRSDR